MKQQPEQLEMFEVSLEKWKTWGPQDVTDALDTGMAFDWYMTPAGHFLKPAGQANFPAIKVTLEQFTHAASRP
jgi:hypothetical protein